MPPKSRTICLTIYLVSGENVSTNTIGDVRARDTRSDPMAKMHEDHAAARSAASSTRAWPQAVSALAVVPANGDETVEAARTVL